MTLLISKFDQFLEIITVTNSVTQLPLAFIVESNNPDSTLNQLPTPSQPKGSAATIERIYAAINLLINYNRQVEYEERWYISIPVIKSLAGGSSFSINEVLKNMKLLLDTHHQSLGLGVQHNRCFHQGQRVTDFVGWDFSPPTLNAFSKILPSPEA